MHAFSVFISMHAHEGYSYVRWWKIYFPVCHSCGPPKGLKLTERGGEGRETQWWYHTPAERCSRKNFKVVFSFLKKKKTTFDLTLFCVDAAEKKAEEKKKRFTYTLSSLIVGVSSAISVFALTCVTYTRAWDSGHRHTHLSVDTPACHPKSCTLRLSGKP